MSKEIDLTQKSNCHFCSNGEILPRLGSIPKKRKTNSNRPPPQSKNCQIVARILDYIKFYTIDDYGLSFVAELASPIKPILCLSQTVITNYRIYF